ncbi:hypothetical protein GCM10027447_09390 [Glycomyces halotolerans]
MPKTNSAAAKKAAKQPARDGLHVERVFTTEGVHPYDEVEWETRDVVMTNWRDGSVNFEQRGVEFPEFWSQNATQIVTSKYFRGAVGTPQRESSLKQLIDRVVRTYHKAGEEHGYFASSQDARIFADELTWLLLHQYFSFNSPVWFNVGTEAAQQVSACQPYNALVSTPAGPVPIGKLVEDEMVGTKVYDATGLTRILAVKANGVKDVLRLHTKSGHALDVTADHLVWKSTGQGTGRFVEAGTLGEGDQLEWHRWYTEGEAEFSDADMHEAALAGWLQADGFVGRYEHGTNRSLTIEAITVTEAEYEWVVKAIEAVFPGAHYKVREHRTQDESLECKRIRLYGEHLRPFIEKWGLLARGTEMTVPERLYTAPLPVVKAYLRSIFQAEGYVSARERSTLVGCDMIGEKLVRGMQELLQRFAIFSRVRRKREPRENRHDLWSLGIQSEGDRGVFATEIGFVCERKHEKLVASFAKKGHPANATERLQIDRIEKLGPQEVYDIQTESGEYLSHNLRVHNCFILSVDDTMESILDWYKEEGMIFKGGSGAGVNLSKIRASAELLSSGGNASGPISFMRGADASAGTIKSGGATRRAAKMVVLDVDHPDIEDFIETKAREEDKIRALRDAGFDVDLGGADMFSVQYQNANNSVRVSDEFMRAVESGGDYALTGRLDGKEISRRDAREVFRKMAEAAWECADPGIQYDDTINDWHTNPNTDRIYASNPCFPADQRVVTDKGLIKIGDLVRRSAEGETFAVFTNDVTAETDAADRVVATNPVRYMVTGTNEIVELRFSDGSRLRCTPGHRLWTENRGWVHADQLQPDDRVVRSNQYAPRSAASAAVPRAAIEAAQRRAAAGNAAIALPEKWDELPDLAHYMGWLVGDGCVKEDGVVTVYGTEAEQRELLPRHQRLLERITGHVSKPSLQANGTRQLRSMRSGLAAFFEALGCSTGRAAEKVLPEALFEADEDTLVNFLQGLFDADGCVVEQDDGTRYIGLGSKSEELLRGVQETLASLGISARIYRTDENEATFRYTKKDGTDVEYASEGPFFDLRITGPSMVEFAALIGFGLTAKSEKLASVLDCKSRYYTDRSVRLVSRESVGFETTYNLTEPRNHSYIVGGVVVANCSEYMSLDDSSCNLASLNLMKFLGDDGSFDVERFVKTVEFVITAMEISISFADFPTEQIAQTTRDYRQLGIGYSNLGAVLMASGHAYDSEDGRALAAAITALMTGASYRRSAEIAGAVGPYAGYEINAEPHQRVMRKHAEAADRVRTFGDIDATILEAAKAEWAKGNQLGEVNGWRNAQASVLAPTGTISFMLDCDTTGIEPDLALVKHKKLVGGGSMEIVNQTVERALGHLGYSEADCKAIIDYIAEHGHVVGAPALAEEHYSVFDCAMGERAISPMGHVNMMAAVQPFLSGAISKCVTAESLVASEDGLIRIGSLYGGEPEGTFRSELLRVASLGGDRKTDAFYYGGVRPTREVVLRSGHRIRGTYQHRLLVAGHGELTWKHLGEIREGDYVATQYGADLWSSVPYNLRGMHPVEPKWWDERVSLPMEMSEELAFLLGAYASEGHTTGSNYSVTITNSVPEVLEMVKAAWKSQFGLDAAIVEQPGKCPGVKVSSKTVVEFMDKLGCGTRASGKRIPDAVLRSPKRMVLAFLQGLALDAYTIPRPGKWGISLASNGLLDDLQAVLTNLGVRHSRVSKYDKKYGRYYDEVYAAGREAQELAGLVPFLEPAKRQSAQELLAMTYSQSTADVVPGVSGTELHELIPRGKSGRNGAGTGMRQRFRHLKDSRTRHVSRETLERVASIPGVELPGWLQQVLDDKLCFSPVAEVNDRDDAEVFDLSVPGSHAFVANGIVNHNTVNVPENATVEDFEEIYFQGWKLGLKALAVYRDNCKVGQPLSAKKKEIDAKVEEVVEKVVEEMSVHSPVRRKLPKRRPSQTTSFTVGGAEGYLTSSSYPDDGLGEVFLKMSKQGSTLAGVMDALSVAISIALQYGVPLEKYVEKFTNMRFEPAGMTDDPDIRMASSVVDYIFRRLALDYLPYEDRAALGILTTAERTAEVNGEDPSKVESEPEVDLDQMRSSAPVEEIVKQELSAEPRSESKPSRSDVLNSAQSRSADAPLCVNCGTKMRPSGSCYACEGCGATSGCS